MTPRTTKKDWSSTIVEVNDLGFDVDETLKAYEDSKGIVDITYPLVPPSNYAELMLILKASPVEEEK